jgi:hydrogenase maturation protease
MTPRILIAGIGNIFLGDDGFGVEVVRRLTERPLPEGVSAIDFGIHGLDLAYALLDGYDGAVLVDATPRGGRPGTLYVIEPDLPEPLAPEAGTMIDTHGMDPVKVLRLVRALGGRLPWLRVVGCEPAALGSEDELLMGLSEPVRSTVDEAIGLIEALIAKLHAEAR